MTNQKFSHAPFAFSDHNNVIVQPKKRDSKSNTAKVILKRDKQASWKAEMGRYLNTLFWPRLFAFLVICEDLLGVFQEVLHTWLDLLMPYKRVRINTTDAPWMTPQSKSLFPNIEKTSGKCTLNIDYSYSYTYTIYLFFLLLLLLLLLLYKKEQDVHILF